MLLLLSQQAAEQDHQLGLDRIPHRCNLIIRSIRAIWDAVRPSVHVNFHFVYRLITLQISHPVSPIRDICSV